MPVADAPVLTNETDRDAGPPIRCPYRELRPAMLMMRSAENRPFAELAKPLDRL